MDDGTSTEHSLLAELRIAACELLEADEAYRMACTLENTSRLARARRRVEELLATEPSR